MVFSNFETYSQLRHQISYRAEKVAYVIQNCQNRLYVSAPEDVKIEFDCEGCKLLTYKSSERAILLQPYFSANEVILKSKIDNSYVSIDTLKVKQFTSHKRIQIFRDQFLNVSEEEEALGFNKDTTQLLNNQPLPKFLMVKLKEENSKPCIENVFKIGKWHFIIVRNKQQVFKSDIFSNEGISMPKINKSLKDGDKFIFYFLEFFQWNFFSEEWNLIQVDTPPISYIINK